MSVFIDESEYFETYAVCSLYYLVAMALHDQARPINGEVSLAILLPQGIQNTQCYNQNMALWRNSNAGN